MKFSGPTAISEVQFFKRRKVVRVSDPDVVSMMWFAPVVANLREYVQIEYDNGLNKWTRLIYDFDEVMT